MTKGVNQLTEGIFQLLAGAAEPQLEESKEADCENDEASHLSESESDSQTEEHCREHDGWEFLTVHSAKFEIQDPRCQSPISSRRLDEEKLADSDELQPSHEINQPSRSQDSEWVLQEAEIKDLPETTHVNKATDQSDDTTKSLDKDISSRPADSVDDTKKGKTPWNLIGSLNPTGRSRSRKEKQENVVVHTSLPEIATKSVLAKDLFHVSYRFVSSFHIYHVLFPHTSSTFK